MPRSSAKLPGVRLLALAAFFAVIALLVASCSEALGVNDYQDSFQIACDVAARCYGPAYKDCATRIARVDTSGNTTRWLELISTTPCLQKCSELRTCLDVEPLCYALSSTWTQDELKTQACGISEECCGFQDGTTVCDDGLCCRALGAPCDVDLDCCPNAGNCVKNHCGGATCAAANEPCLNPFQCCSGRCADNHFCEDIPCPPEGFACDTDADCCDLSCIADAAGQKRCTHPSCAQTGEPCKSASDCCDATQQCFKGDDPAATSGVCSTGACIPDNADCSVDPNGNNGCCSGYCHPQYHFCGDCVALGETCSAGVPCCNDHCVDGACAAKTP